MADIFSDDTPIDVGLNDLVGEGQKYKSPDELAKAYANLEAHSRKIEAENAKIRAERDTREAGNTSTKQGQDDLDPADQPDKSPKQEAPKRSDDVDLRSQIREEVTKLSEEEKLARNLETTASKMAEVYGSPQEATAAIKAKAAELDVGVDWLRNMAATSPKLFFNTMGVDAPQRSTSTPSSGNGARFGQQDTTRNFEYFDKMRRDNPKQYFSAATQQEMLKQARTMGGDFYKR